MLKLSVALVAFSAFWIGTAEAKPKINHADQARASSAVMFTTSGYPDWAKAALGGGEGNGGESGGAGGCP